MKTRLIGGLEVSAIGLGCMSFASTYGPAGDHQEAIAILRSAYDLGVTHFDTAEAYGPFANDELVGEALQPIRDKVVIATKFGFDIDLATGKRNGGVNSRPDHIKAVAEAALSGCAPTTSSSFTSTASTQPSRSRTSPVRSRN